MYKDRFAQKENKMNYSFYNDRYVTYSSVRSLLILFNVAFWICGLSLIWIGITMQTEFQNYLKINEAYSYQAPFVILTFGAVIVFVSLLACSCIVKVQPSMLIVYGVFLIIILFSLFRLSIYVHKYKINLLNSIANGIWHQITNYDHQHPKSSANTMDFIQRNLHCCGNQSFLDWPESQIPLSCFGSPRSIAQTPIMNDASNVFKIGCYYKLYNVLYSYFTTLIVATSAIALFPLFGSILSIGLSMMYDTGGYEIII